MAALWCTSWRVVGAPDLKLSKNRHAPSPAHRRTGRLTTPGHTSLHREGQGQGEGGRKERGQEERDPKRCGKLLGKAKKHRRNAEARTYSEKCDEKSRISSGVSMN